MDKVRVDAKEVLYDINAGMDDLSLMQKYRLSYKGLRSLFRKLGEMALIRLVNARDLLIDLASGMSDIELMHKYHLSERTLQSLLTEIDRTGLLASFTQPDQVPETITLRVTEIAHSIKTGMSRPELKKNYGLSERGLRWITSVLVSEGHLSWREVYEKICASYEEIIPDKPRRYRRYKASSPLLYTNSNSHKFRVPFETFQRKALAYAVLKPEREQPKIW